MKPLRDRHKFPQRLHVAICSMEVSEGSQFSRLFLLSSVWVLRVVSNEVVTRSSGRLCVASSCDWWLVLSTDGDRCHKCRGTCSKCLCILPEVPSVAMASTVSGRRCSSILETSCPAKLCFEEQGIDGGNLSHFTVLGVGDEVSPTDG